jgi:hypothetical protein
MSTTINSSQLSLLAQVSSAGASIVNGSRGPWAALQQAGLAQISPEGASAQPPYVITLTAAGEAAVQASQETSQS